MVAVIVVVRSGPWRSLPTICFVFLIYGFLGYYSERFLKKYKNQRKEIVIQRDRLITTMIMSKNELMQSSLWTMIADEFALLNKKLKTVFFNDSTSRILTNDPIVFLADMIKLPLFARSGLAVIG